MYFIDSKRWSIIGVWAQNRTVSRDHKVTNELTHGYTYFLVCVGVCVWAGVSGIGRRLEDVNVLENSSHSLFLVE